MPAELSKWSSDFVPLTASVVTAPQREGDDDDARRADCGIWSLTEPGCAKQ